MDQQINFDDLLTQVIGNETQYQPLGGPEIVSVCDHQTGQYMLVAVGWQKDRHINQIVFHARLLNGLVVIETDNTEEGLKNELVEAGLPASQIVFGTQHRPIMAEAMAA
ncbi:MAG: XisI protein [Acidobacteria bacterium]|nr:XisI protein [Acidobacteriota bacterium]